MARIVHITSVHWPYDIRIFEKECRSLSDAGHDVVLVAPGATGGNKNGVELVSLPPVRSRFSRMFVTARNALAIASSLNGDVYHIHDPELLIWKHSLQKTGKPIIYDMHENLPQQIRDKVWIPRLLRKPLATLSAHIEGWLLKGMPVIVAEPSYIRSRPWLVEYREVLNYPRLEWLADLTEAPLTESPIWSVGYLGTITEDRGCLRTISALGKLANDGLELGFDCIGQVDSVLIETMRKQAVYHKVKNLELPGRLDPRLAWAKMKTCRVGLALLEPLPNYVESIPTKLFEYMALGLPVIVSDFPAYREIVDRHACGIVVDPLDVDAIADAIAWLYNNPDEAGRMGKNGMAAAPLYSWESERDELLSFYSEILKKSAH